MNNFPFIYLIIILFVGGCGNFLGHRSFQDIMQEEPYQFFTPNQDFPTVMGDRSTGNSLRAIKKRTPLSNKEKERFDREESLEEELQHLVEELSEEDYQQYLRYQEKFSKTSEKIYFLRLRTKREKDQYLLSKGFYDSKFEDYDKEIMAIKRREVVLGMTKDAVLQSWGSPTRIEVAGNPRYENERWAFFKAGKLQYVYFENGTVQGWSEDY